MKKKLPNIIFIVMDTVGAKHMSLYGYQRKTTPNLERIAEECTVYTRCFAPASWTIPSHASMFTGLYPSQHGAYEGRFFLNDNVQHLVSVLKMMGYRTLGISANGLVSPASGLCRDFDYFKDFGALHLELFVKGFRREPSRHQDELSALLTKGASVKEKLLIFLQYIFETGQCKVALERAQESIKGRILNLIRPEIPVSRSAPFTEKTLKIYQEIIQQQSSDPSQPFFLFINFLEAHEPYSPPLKWRKFSRWYDKQLWSMADFYHKAESVALEVLMRKYRNLHDDEILYLDHIIYQLWSILNQSGLAAETMLIITSDHGEQIGERGMYGHSVTLYNDLIWVPLIIHYPKKGKKGIDDRLVSLNDLYTTTLELVNCPLPGPETSVSLLSTSKRDSLLAQQIYPESFPGFKTKLENYKLQGSNFSPHIFSLINANGMKIIKSRDGSLEIYNLDNDMDEVHNLVKDMSSDNLNDIRNIMNSLEKDTKYQEAMSEVRKKFAIA